MPGGRLVAQALAAHDVDVVFTGRPGPLADGCGAEGLRVVPVDDPAAGHAAWAWGHMRRTAGVAAVADVAAAVPALARAHREQTPLVVLGTSGSAGARPVAKWTGGCERAARIPELVAAAFRHALAQPRGPAYLFLPRDVLRAEAVPDREPSPSRSAARVFGDPREIMQAAALLAAAERPVVVAGSAIWWDGARRQLRAFAENGRLPVFLAGSARGALAPGHELLFRHERDAVLAAADAVCAIGTRLPRGTAAGARIVHIHADATELGRDRAPDAGIVGDTAAVLGILADAVKYQAADRDPWLARLHDGETALAGRSTDLDLRWLADELEAVLAADAVLIAGEGESAARCVDLVRSPRPGQRLDAGPWALAYAAGVRAAHPGRQIASVSETADGVRVACTPDGAADAVTEAVELPEDLRPALERALAAGEPADVDVRLGG